MPPRDAVERLAALPFVEPGRDGLFIHDAVRTAIAGALATRDPDAHRSYRRAAWAFLQSRLRLGHGNVEPWRYTADLLFLIQNPVIREAFFPSGPQPLAIEPATPDDEPAVQQIVAARAAPEREALLAWWRYHPDGFRIVRDRDGATRGFCVRVRASDLHEAVDASDPVAAAWRRDVALRDPSAALLCRRWLDRDVGEGPCASLSAFFVDLKRSYMEMRGTLRWVYTVVANPAPFGDFGARLGFRPLADAATDVGGQILYSALLDMGPGSVDAWLAELMGAEITAEDIESSKRLDVDAHELVLSSGRVALTSLEFGVMRYLQERPGKAVGRYDLMEAVWGSRSPTASNVVDVVVRSLRRKLGGDAACVETVRGTGYRYRVPTASDRPESGRPRGADHSRRTSQR
jgi:DNA-binding winged helix-turn-helix (wHTH) protein